MSRTILEQITQFRLLLEGKKFPRDSQLFNGVVEFIAKLPPLQVRDEDKVELRNLVCHAFDMTNEELIEHVYGAALQTAGGTKSNDAGTTFKRSTYDPHTAERELDALIPSSGYFRDYVNYTSRSESPLSYHFFSSVVGVAAVCNRRVYIPMGYFNFYASTGVIILGPSGMRKTSASDITVKMLSDLKITPVYSEKLTPEALIDSMKGENATGLIYAPEMAVFLNRQKYNEGLVQLITRFMDCPDEWASGTIMRGKTPLREIAISVLMCSTPDWFVTNVPEDTFGGGFVARNLLVVQDSTARCEPRPVPGDPTLRERLMMQLAYFHVFQGEVRLTPSAERRHVSWYREHIAMTMNPEHELLGTYYQRKQGHVLRLAMCLHIGTHYEHDPYTLCEECFDRAVNILNWNEKFLPNLFRQLFKSQSGQDTELILRQIRSNGGVMQHSQLIRKMQYKFDATRVKGILASLKEAGQIKEEHNILGHVYILQGTTNG